MAMLNNQMVMGFPQGFSNRNHINEISMGFPKIIGYHEIWGLIGHGFPKEGEGEYP